jgi:hypothetical protein
MACLAITGSMNSTPTAALEIMLNLPPLHICVEAEALKTAHRLHILKQWKFNSSSHGHCKLLADMLTSNSQFLAPSDILTNLPLYEGNYEVVFPTREQ